MAKLLAPQTLYLACARRRLKELVLSVSSRFERRTLGYPGGLTSNAESTGYRMRGPCVSCAGSPDKAVPTSHLQKSLFEMLLAEKVVLSVGFSQLESVPEPQNRGPSLTWSGVLTPSGRIQGPE